VSESTNPRLVLARRVEFGLIAVGGLFLIIGWGIRHEEWARAVGWLFTGIGFAIEMVYGRVAKAAKKQEDAEEEPRVTDESTP
jgi:hypothetical protein